MKILIHLNHGVNKSYMLDFGSSVTHKDVSRLLGAGEDSAVKSLLCYATIRNAQKVELSSHQTQQATFQADIIISQHGYTAERLA